MDEDDDNRVLLVEVEENKGADEEGMRARTRMERRMRLIRTDLGWNWMKKAGKPPVPDRGRGIQAVGIQEEGGGF